LVLHSYQINEQSKVSHMDIPGDSLHTLQDWASNGLCT
jgi:hypothetical protein